MKTAPPSPGQLRRLAEELAESGLELHLGAPLDDLLVGEIHHALRPPVHERRAYSTGTFVEPTTDPVTWSAGTSLDILRGAIEKTPLADVRRFADGLSSWIIRWTGGPDEWVVFDRPAGSERDLVVLADVLGATVVQRHPTGTVRVTGSAFGVLRWDGLSWHHEPPVSSWMDAMAACDKHGDPIVLRALLEFAVHDLGSRGIGATLVYRPDDERGGGVEPRLPAPPPLQVNRPAGLAPLRHALAQVDGAAIFDSSGTLRQIGARLVPSPDAEDTVDGYRGMRHTSARRYSYDEPLATVIVVSEDGPLTVLRDGELIGRSPS
jgi:hypothetical protein